MALISFLMGYELIHHRVTQGITEFNQFEIKRIELRETLCYSVVKTHFCTSFNQKAYVLVIEWMPWKKVRTSITVSKIVFSILSAHQH